MGSNKRNFQVLIALAILLLSTSPFTSQGQCNDQSKGGHIKILTWNIYMLPRLFIHTGQVDRAQQIAQVLKTQDADVIVFEEAFDNKARGIIRDSLKSIYPYESGDPQKNVFWKTSCGVWIISKVKINVVKQIFFAEAQGADRLATKGAILVEGQVNGFCFQLVGTHLQSDPNSGKNVQDIRKKQYEEIRTQLLEPYVEQGVPQFVAGDFNTIKADTNNHTQLVDSLKLTECPLTGEKTFSYDYGNNDLISGPMGKPQLIDYVFYSKQASVPNLAGQMHIVTFRKQWDIGHVDLSDHFAVAADFSF